MTRAEQYSKDQSIEQSIAQFMDVHFYNKFAKKTTVKRHTDKPSQFKGIDVTLGNWKIDEKAKVYGLLNQILQYPSFELQINNKADQIMDGWFINPTLETTHYCFIAVYTSATKESNITYNNITALNALFVKKSEIKEFVQSKISLDDLYNDIESLRDGFGMYDRMSYEHKQFWLKLSSTLPEKPINLVTKRDILKTLPSTKEFLITPTTITKL